MEVNIDDVGHSVASMPCRSAWDRGVKRYAAELVENLRENNRYLRPDSPDEYLYSSDKKLEGELLNGAMDWNEYSWGGSSLIYDKEIAERLCTKSELKKFGGGNRSPWGQQWPDIQSRALYQASRKVIDAFHEGVVNNNDGLGRREL